MNHALIAGLTKGALRGELGVDAVKVVGFALNASPLSDTLQAHSGRFCRSRSRSGHSAVALDQDQLTVSGVAGDSIVAEVRKRN